MTNDEVHVLLGGLILFVRRGQRKKTKTLPSCPTLSPRSAEPTLCVHVGHDWRRDRARCLAVCIQRRARCSVVCCVNQLASVYWPSKMFGTTVFIMVLVLAPPQLSMFCALGWQVFEFSKSTQRPPQKRENFVDLRAVVLSRGYISPY